MPDKTLPPRSVALLLLLTAALLLLHHKLPDSGLGGNFRDAGRHLQTANCLGHVFAVNFHHER